MQITLINPPLISQRGDVFGSGIPYVPITLCYLSSYLKSKNYKVKIVDSFGEKPLQKYDFKSTLVQGLKKSEIIKKVKKSDIIFVYAANIMQHPFIVELVSEIKNKTNSKIIVFENSNAVTGYSLELTYEDFFNNGADYVIVGEPEERAHHLLTSVEKNKPLIMDGIFFRKGNKIIYNKKTSFIDNIDELPFPDYESLPLTNYWKLSYAHGPLTSKKYLPLLTSRGCPFPCGFCSIVKTNNKRWRARTAKNVVDEIEYFNKKLGVEEFHLEDVNPTVVKKRMKEISNEILKRNLKITWKICAGTKIETLDKETLNLMAKSGLSYLSFSPESGSARVLKLMKKPFHHELALELTTYMNELGIKTQACFVLGYPGETKKDRKLTENYVMRMAKSGVDEIALFIMTPVPGARMFDKIRGYRDYSELSFSPTWRADYKELHSFRKKLYIKFLLVKLINHPFKTIKMVFNILTKRFETKTEMAFYRYFKLYVWGRL